MNRKILILIAIISLFGCVAEADYSQEDSRTYHVKSIDGYVVEFKSKSGYDCIYVTEGLASGLSCNFNQGVK